MRTVERMKGVGPAAALRRVRSAQAPGGATTIGVFTHQEPAPATRGIGPACRKRPGDFAEAARHGIPSPAPVIAHETGQRPVSSPTTTSCCRSSPGQLLTR